MTTALSKSGNISLPEPVRDQLHLVAGQDFEVFVEDDNTITLRLVSQPANQGLVELLRNIPAQFEIPLRETDDSTPLEA